MQAIPSTGLASVASSKHSKKRKASSPESTQPQRLLDEHYAIVEDPGKKPPHRPGNEYKSQLAQYQAAYTFNVTRCLELNIPFPLPLEMATVTAPTVQPAEAATPAATLKPPPTVMPVGRPGTPSPTGRPPLPALGTQTTARPQGIILSPFASTPRTTVSTADPKKV
jgi:hypothetical protein